MRYLQDKLLNMKYLDSLMKKREFIKMTMAAFGASAMSKPRSAISSVSAPGMQKYSIEAKYYEKEDGRVVCTLCPNECALRPGKIGDCHTRINDDGRLFSIAYGNPCAINIDPIEKKPLYHFLPSSRTFSIGTAGCNLHCMNCLNWSISQSSPMETQNYELMPQDVVKAAKRYNCQTIAYTYNDPIVYYEYALETAKIARKEGLKNIIVSAGYINDAPIRELAEHIDAANIDLKSFSDDIYKKLNKGRLDPVLNTLKVLKEKGVWLEITNLIVPQWTDDLDMIRRMCQWLADNGLAENPLHFSRFSPMYQLKHLPPTPVETLQNAYEIAKEEGIKYVFVGNVFNNKGEDTYCPSCGKQLIDRRGFSVEKIELEDGKCRYCGEKIAGIWQ